MRLLARLARGAGLAILVSAGFVAAPNIATATTPVVGHVYVNDNTAGTNTIGGFDQHADGSLTPLAGSPFSAGGAGTGTIVGSQGAIQVASHGRYVLAVDAGSNQISVLAVGADGSLSPRRQPGLLRRASSPSASRSTATWCTWPTRANGTTGSNYTGFRLAGDGRLTPLSDSTVSLPPTALPGDILFNGTGKNLIGIEVGTTDPSTFLIDSFLVGADGRLTPAAGSPFPAEAAGPFGSEFSPTDPHHLYVSNAHGGAGNGSVSAFSVNPNAKVKSIDGLAVRGRSDGAVLGGDLARRAVPVRGEHRQHDDLELPDPVERVAPIPDRARRSAAAPGSGRSTRGSTSRGHYLYVVDAAIASVSGFAVSGGSLTELASSPTALPTGATPFGIAIVAS